MPVDLDFPEDLRDPAHGIDDDSRTLDAHVVHPEQGLLLPEAERIRQAMILIDEEIVRQPIFFPEPAM